MLAAFVLFLQYFESPLESHKLGPFAYVALGPTAVVLALLMVSTVRYPKDRLKSFILEPKHAFLVLGVCAFVIAIVHYAVTESPAIVLFPLMLAYVLFGLWDTLWLRWQERRQTEPARGETGPDAREESRSPGATP